MPMMTMKRVIQEEEIINSFTTVPISSYQNILDFYYTSAYMKIVY